ncbi:PH domain-containing protein [Aquipuribacter nitratireducens]|uniref:PH domain-containing protein n=1 Tax=Aquipuribacter nitratireducens TaxID=650104 RepID=A0ABW0GRF1_9MICO
MTTSQPEPSGEPEAPGSAHAVPRDIPPRDILPPVEGAEPFDPEGVRWTRVSPRLTWVRLAGAGIFLLLTVVASVVLLVVADSRLGLLPLAVGVVVAVVSLVVVPRQVRAWGYAEREEDLLVRHGIMFRALTVVPYGRMQYVDVSAGPVDRALGLATVRLHTASASTDATIPGLTKEAAARLRDRLSQAGRAQLAGL